LSFQKPKRRFGREVDCLQMPFLLLSEYNLGLLLFKSGDYLVVSRLSDLGGGEYSLILHTWRICQRLGDRTGGVFFGDRHVRASGRALGEPNRWAEGPPPSACARKPTREPPTRREIFWKNGI
jgi:hypothetical protein